MSGKKYHILMGDVVSSSDYDASKLGKNLKALVNTINKTLNKNTLSPYTVTLGDEFQGVTKNLHSGIETLFCFEELCLKQSRDFQLHYVLLYGEIDTELNREIAYEMMGDGLKRARTQLTEKKRDRKRFKFDLGDEIHSSQLERAFMVVDGISKKWKIEDYPLIYDMIKNDSDSTVGEKYGKDRSQIWKRRNTLMIDEYNHLKDFILTYVGEK